MFVNSKERYYILQNIRRLKTDYLDEICTFMIHHCIIVQLREVNY